MAGGWESEYKTMHLDAEAGLAPVASLRVVSALCSMLVLIDAFCVVRLALFDFHIVENTGSPAGTHRT